VALRQLDQTELAQHVQILGWVHILGELMTLALGLCGFVFMTGIGAASGDPDAARILPFIGTMAFGFFTLLALPGLAAGIGLLRRKAWARYLALVVGLFELVFFPIGTIIGLYTFWVLLQAEAPAFFEDWSADGLDAFEG
jgi:hypothetical protein